LSRIRTGDWIVLDVAARRIDVDVPQAELDARAPSAELLDAVAKPTRGWEKLYVDSVLGADTGADLDFLIGASGSAVSRESH
jgi:dihydroxyacid dehydratase/phosphogluconate dehydratase